MYPLDHSASAILKPLIIVINLDKHYVPCSHCKAVCFSESGYTEYFDSCGLPPFKLEINSYLQRHLISWTFNHHRIQGLTSNVCGYYCCLYTLHKASGQSMTSFVSTFVLLATLATIKGGAHVPSSVWLLSACGRLEQQQSWKQQI